MESQKEKEIKKIEIKMRKKFINRKSAENRVGSEYY